MNSTGPTHRVRALLEKLRCAHPASIERMCWALPVLLVISLFYVFMASVGRFRDLPTQTDYYDLMCEGFRAGHLYIKELPSPWLLAQPDPFAYSNAGGWLWDASLYKGHYYMYWGPVPGLMLLAFKVLTRTHERITDQWPTTLLMLGRLYAGAALILSLASRVRLRQPAWICSLAIAVFGLANPSPFIVARPHVYEACLAGGQCFLFWGLFWAFWGLEKPAHRGLFFVLASASWALACGCRATNFVSVPLLIAITAAFAWYASRPPFKAWVGSCLALGLPAAVAAGAYGVYNYERFDSVFEFGVHYQVTLQPFTGNSAYIVPNIFSYLFAPVGRSCRFPFVRILGWRPLSPWLDWPPGYQSFERVGGIMLTAAWCWLVLLSVWRIGAYLASQTRGPAPSAAPGFTRHEVWLTLCSVAIVLSMVPVLSLWEASMRYAGDAVGGIVLVASLGAFWLLQRSYRVRRHRLGFVARGLVLALGLQTCVVGALTAFSTTDDQLRAKNPFLYQALEDHLSLCSSR
jgi:hypothetical protein